MIVPIYGYGESVLRKVGKEIDKNYPNFPEILQNMYDTMYNARGVGLAAPQIGLDIRLFVVDTTPFADSDDVSKEEAALLDGFKKTFINAEILKEEGSIWAFNEGCLSIPDIREDVYRHDKVTIKYFDENFVEYTETYSGLIARVIQHEYDHIEGVLFVDKIAPIRKKMITKKLGNIMEGKARPDYRMKFAGIKGK